MSQSITQQEAAERLGLTAQAIGKWATKPGCPARTSGGKRMLLWPDFARWREQELERQARDETMARLVGGDLSESQKRRAAAEAIKAEIEVEVLQGRLMEKSLYETRLGAICDLLAAKVKSAPGKHAHRTVGLKSQGESQAVWEDCCRDLLTALSDTDLPDEEAA